MPTVPPKSASRHAPIQAEPVVSPTVSYMSAHWHALNYPELVVARTMVSTTVMILNPYPNFPPFILRSRSLVPHSFPHAPLGPSPNHLTSHLMDHMTNPQSTITCHHSAVRSIMTCPHLTLFDLPAHDGVFLDCQLMMKLYLEPPRHDCTLVIFPYFFVTSDPLLFKCI